MGTQSMSYLHNMQCNLELFSLFLQHPSAGRGKHKPQQGLAVSCSQRAKVQGTVKSEELFTIVIKLLQYRRVKPYNRALTSPSPIDMAYLNDHYPSHIYNHH